MAGENTSDGTTIRIDKETHKKLLAEKDKTGIPVSTLVKKLVSGFLKEIG